MDLSFIRNQIDLTMDSRQKVDFPNDIEYLEIVVGDKNGVIDFNDFSNYKHEFLKNMNAEVEGYKFSYNSDTDKLEYKINPNGTYQLLIENDYYSLDSYENEIFLFEKGIKMPIFIIRYDPELKSFTDKEKTDNKEGEKESEKIGTLFSAYEGFDFYIDENGNVRCYDKKGNIVINEFKCDGIYTYYFQLDGTAMKDRLTYHPDGVHIIYFDENGHEVFSNFAHVKKSIAGDAVDDLCFFDVYGYMYVNFLTFNQDGTALYYANPYGVMECNGWFRFAGNAGYVAEAYGITEGTWGYAYKDGRVDPSSFGDESIKMQFIPISDAEISREPLTQNQVFDAIVNYCVEQNPSLVDALANGYNLGWWISDLNGDEYMVTFRSYTGAYEYFHANIYSGNVYSYEYVSGIIDEPTLTDTNFNAYDYLYENTVYPMGEWCIAGDDPYEYLAGIWGSCSMWEYNNLYYVKFVDGKAVYMNYNNGTYEEYSEIKIINIERLEDNSGFRIYLENGTMYENSGKDYLDCYFDNSGEMIYSGADSIYRIAN